MKATLGVAAVVSAAFAVTVAVASAAVPGDCCITVAVPVANADVPVVVDDCTAVIVVSVFLPLCALWENDSVHQR